MEIPVAAAERIIREAGAKRVSKEAALLFAEWMESIISEIARSAGEMASHAGRKTVTEEDVFLSGKRLGYR